MNLEYKKIGGVEPVKKTLEPFGFYERCYLSADHLLIVKNTQIYNQFRRFYLKDITEIVTCVNPHYRYHIPREVALLALLILPVFLVHEDAKVFMIFLIGLPFILIFTDMVINLIKGPKIYCVIKTRTQELVVKPFCRKRGWAKVREILIPAIQKAQADIQADPPLQHEANETS